MENHDKTCVYQWAYPYRNNFLWLAGFALLLAASDLIFGEKIQTAALVPQILVAYYIQRALLLGGEMRFSALDRNQRNFGRYFLAWLAVMGMAVLFVIAIFLVIELLAMQFLWIAQSFLSAQPIITDLTSPVAFIALCACFGPLFPAVVAGERFSLKTALNRSRGQRLPLAFGLLIGPGALAFCVMLLAGLAERAGVIDLQPGSPGRFVLKLMVELSGTATTAFALALFDAAWARRDTDVPGVFA